MRSDPAKDHKAIEKELHSCCSYLWTEYVRENLIFSKNLLFCRSCNSFFYCRVDHDHPSEHVVLVQKHFVANDITSLAKMVEYFRPATKLAKPGLFDFSLPTLPAFSHLHRRQVCSLGPGNSSQAKDQPVFLCADNTMAAKEHIDFLNKTICSLQSELDTLREENAELRIEIMKNNSKVQFEKRSIIRLANHIILHCDQECRCDAIVDGDIELANSTTDKAN